MKASELIAELQAAIDAHGDLEVLVEEALAVTGVDFAEPAEAGAGTLVITAAE